MNTPSLKIYLAGKVSKDSSFGVECWREVFCRELSVLTGREIMNLDPTKNTEGHGLDENNPKLIFGRDSYLIRSADLVVVYLSDDISVGGSQEMLIAKYYGKPLVGLLPEKSKFSGDKLIGGQRFKNWLHPFVKIPCDFLVSDITELGRLIVKTDFTEYRAKNMEIIDENAFYYRENFGMLDPDLPEAKFKKYHLAQKAVVIDLSRGILAIRYRNAKGVADKVRGKFALPGGKLAVPFENPESSLARRVAEETGVEVSPTHTTYGAYGWTYHRMGVENSVLAISRRSLYRQGEIRKPLRRTEFDLEGASWIPLHQLQLNQFVADEQPVIYKALHSIEIKV